MINRRRFISASGKSVSSAMLFPFFLSCGPETQSVKKLKFSGRIMGEDHLAGHCWKDGKLQPGRVEKTEHIYDVLIAGGGPCGLAAAWKLTKSGVRNFLLVEKEDKPGGLCLSGESNGNFYACASHYADYPGPDQKHLIELYTDCGILEKTGPDGWPVIKEDFVLKGQAHNIFVKGEWEANDFPYRIATENDVREMERFFSRVDELSAWKDDSGKPALGLPLANISQNREVRDLDKISMMDFFQSEGYRSELLKWYLDTWLVDEYGTPVEKCSAWAGLQFFRTVKGSPLGDGEKETMFFPGGLGYLTRKLDGFIPEKNKQNESYVVRMENCDGHVKSLIYNEKKGEFYELKSKFAIYAIPKSQVYFIVKGLQEDGRTEFHNLPYSCWLTAVIHLKRPPGFPQGKIAWENSNFDSWTLGYVNNMHPLEKAENNGKSILTYYICFSEEPDKKRSLLLKKGWEFWAKTVLQELEKTHSGIHKEVERMDIWKWGHPMKQVLPGTVFGSKRLKMLEPFGSIYFGHADVCGIPVFEETTYRGVEIAEQILKGMGREFASSLSRTV